MLTTAFDIQLQNDKYMEDDDIKLHLCYSRLAYNLGPSDRQLLCTLIQCVMSHVHKSSEEMTECTQQKHQNIIRTTIPTTLSDVRKIYLEGKNSLIQNLPTPLIYKCDDDHAYVKVEDVIKHFFAFGAKPELLKMFEHNYNDTISYPTESKAGQRIAKTISGMANHEMEEASVLITEWHDDFEPNTQSKQNRGSVWILSITILSQRKEGSNSKYYTFPIAIGEKNTSHEEILNMYYNDLNELYNNPIKGYDKLSNCNRSV